MVLTPGTKVIILTTSGIKTALPIRSANLPGNIGLLLNDSGRKRIVVKLASVAPGDMTTSIPDSGGKKIAVKCGGILPNPPPSAGWSHGAGSWGDYSYAMIPWGAHIYWAGGGASGAFISRYSPSTGWEAVLNWGNYPRGYFYDLRVFDGKLYAAHSGGGGNGGIARSADGSYGSFTMVYDTGSESNYVDSLEVHNGKLYGILFDNSINKKKVISSPDGTTWSEIFTVPSADEGMWRLTSDGTKLYTGYYIRNWGTGYYDADVYSSTDGTAWTPEGWSFAGGGIAYEMIYGIKYLNGHLYAGCYYWGRVYRDGVLVKGQEIGSLITGVYDFCECEGLLFAASGDDPNGLARVYCSEDNGLTWTTVYTADWWFYIMQAIGAFGKNVFAGSSRNATYHISPEIK